MDWPLGLTPTMGRSYRQIFEFLKKSVWKKLEVWKEKSLSKVGREVLIKVVV